MSCASHGGKLGQSDIPFQFGYIRFPNHMAIAESVISSIDGFHCLSWFQPLAYLGKSLNSVLYDAWASCGEGNWTESKFLMKIRDRHSTKKRGVRRWLTATKMNARFGEDLAEQIRNRKLLDKELNSKEVRAHPELPDNEDLHQI